MLRLAPSRRRVNDSERGKKIKGLLESLGLLTIYMETPEIPVEKSNGSYLSV